MTTPATTAGRPAPDRAPAADTSVRPALADALVPFRLWIAGARASADLVFDGRASRVEPPAPRTGPVMLTTSGLGDHTVQEPRTQVFRRLMEGVPPASAQRRFHEWEDQRNGALGTLTSREDARTVSRTIIDVCSSFAELHHIPLDDDLRAVSAPRPARIALEPALTPPRPESHDLNAVTRTS